MKLVTYDPGSGPRAGVLVDDGVLDATALLGTAYVLRDVQALLELPDHPLERLHAALERVSAPSAPLARVRLRAPVLRPPSVRDFMAFEGHAGFYVKQVPEVWRRLPIFYFSNPLRIFGPDEEVPFPAATHQLDYECELAAIVLREGANVLEADADQYIAGFTIFNAWSCRDLQSDESQFGLGPAKGKDSASSLGPWIVTRDEMAPYYRNGTLHVQCTVRVNGVVWMDGNAWNMHHTFGAMFERADLAPPRVEEISRGIFAYIQPDGSWFLNNTGFLVGRRGIVSIDTTSTERRTRAYLEAIASVTNQPVRTLI